MLGGWLGCCFFFFFKQKTAYEMVGSDWSSDVCSSDLGAPSRSRTFPHFGDPCDPHGVSSICRSGWRSEERRVGKECYQPCRSRRGPCPKKKKKMYLFVRSKTMTIWPVYLESDSY